MLSKFLFTRKRDSREGKEGKREKGGQGERIRRERIPDPHLTSIFTLKNLNAPGVTAHNCRPIAWKTEGEELGR